MPTTKMNTIARLNFRPLSEAKEKIERAAIASGLTVTDFAIPRRCTTSYEYLKILYRP